MGNTKGKRGGKRKERDAAIARAVSLYRDTDLDVSEIIAETGVSRAELFRYLDAFDAVDATAGRRQDGPDAFAEKEVPPAARRGKLVEPPDGELRQKCAQPDYSRFWEMVEDRRGVRLLEPYDTYLRECIKAGFRPLQFSSFCVGLRRWRKAQEIESAPEWHPGECMATYWSSVPVNGEQRTVFVAQLVFSDATFACLSDGMSPLAWMLCCERALRFFGGVPHVVDCSVVGAGAAGVTGKTLATLQGFAGHYRFVLYGARPKTVKTAGRSVKPLGPWNSSVVMRRVRGDFAKMEVAEEDVESTLSNLVEHYNNISLNGRNRRYDLKHRELPQMLRLPKKSYDMAFWDTRVVGADYHFVLCGVRYSVPWQLAGHEVRIRYTDDEVHAFAAGREVAVHRRIKNHEGRAIVTDDAHRPPKHRHYAHRMNHRFLALADDFGPATHSAMKAILEKCKRGGNGFRECKELVDLAKSPSKMMLEDACAMALASSGEVDVATIRALMGGA